MLIYEVNAKVPVDLRKEYSELVRDHREKLLTQPGFQSMDGFERKPEDEGGKGDEFLLWTLHYRVKDRPSLEAYINGLGKTLRDEARIRFQGRVEVSRRILSPTSF